MDTEQGDTTHTLLSVHPSKWLDVHTRACHLHWPALTLPVSISRCLSLSLFFLSFLLFLFFPFSLLFLPLSFFFCFFFFSFFFSAYSCLVLGRSASSLSFDCSLSFFLPLLCFLLSLFSPRPSSSPPLYSALSHGSRFFQSVSSCWKDCQSRGVLSSSVSLRLTSPEASILHPNHPKAELLFSSSGLLPFFLNYYPFLFYLLSF